MIKRSRKGVAIPYSLTSKECKDSLNSIIADIISGDKDRIRQGKENISSDYYRGCAPDGNGLPHQDVVIALKGIYNNKCAFCESKRYKPEVEHFRPKKMVVGLPKTEHNGYYWLCYEWTNLIPSCSDCNDTKGNHFPIFNEDKRVYSPTYNLDNSLCEDENIYYNAPLIDEKPVLLHPEYDDHVEECFRFNAEGHIFGKDDEGRGGISITRYGLDSDDLNYSRQEHIDNIVEKFGIALITDNPIPPFTLAMESLEKKADDNAGEYTLMHKYILSNFEDLIIPLLPPPAMHIALSLYEDHIKKAIQRTD